MKSNSFPNSLYFTKGMIIDMTKYIKKEQIDNNTIYEIANELKQGKIVVFPTDTVYGIGTNAYNEEACEKVYEDLNINL